MGQAHLHLQKCTRVAAKVTPSSNVGMCGVPSVSAHSKLPSMLHLLAANILSRGWHACVIFTECVAKGVDPVRTAIVSKAMEWKVAANGSPYIRYITWAPVQLHCFAQLVGPTWLQRPALR